MGHVNEDSLDHVRSANSLDFALLHVISYGLFSPLVILAPFVMYTTVISSESGIIGKFTGKTIEMVPEARVDGRICLAMGLMICSESRLV